MANLLFLTTTNIKRNRLHYFNKCIHEEMTSNGKLAHK
jgi:hypothetical protein